MESVLAGAHDLGMYVHVAGAWMARAGSAARRGLGLGTCPASPRV